jgi:anhydro-N-acetylmuramic acid kinase
MGSEAMLAVGLMSGTSLDGIDAALVETDGEGHVRPIAFRSEPYSDRARRQLQEVTRLALACDRPRQTPEIVEAAEMLTRRHVLAIHQLLAAAGVPIDHVGVVGFHGQTVAHRPDRGWTWQIGDGAGMAARLGVPVVDDFRSADVRAGGQGAPLIPGFHRALRGSGGPPVAVLNLGGIGNISFIDGDRMIAFDTGPANGLIDDWMEAEAGLPYDAGGALAGSGTIDRVVLTAMLDNPWFDLPPPKSLDRADFSIAPARGLAPATGAATLTAFTASTVALALTRLPARPTRLVVAGGGRHNATLMAMLEDACEVTVEPIEAMGWDGDATEAQGFAYMAVRSLRGLPISFPETTGVPRAMTGGAVHWPLRADGSAHAGERSL